MINIIYLNCAIQRLIVIHNNLLLSFILASSIYLYIQSKSCLHSKFERFYYFYIHLITQILCLCQFYYRLKS